MRHLLFLLLLAGTALPAFSQQTASWETDARNAVETGQWDRAIRLLDPVLDAEPEELTARLLRAICYREKAKGIFQEARVGYHLSPSDLKTTWRAAQSAARGVPWQLPTGGRYHVTRAIFDFEQVLARDSSFAHVLYEYARLWHDHYVFDRAISLGEAQVAAKPDIPEAHVELVAAYRHFVAWTRAEKALEWLAEHDTPYARYFVGEIHRREGRLDEADRVYRAILDASQIPPQPALLSQARVRLARNAYEDAYAFIEQAMQFDTLVEARLLYDDFIYVMEEAEYARSPDTVGEYAEFFDRLWARRNPTPASPINWRLLEHYRRLLVAEREYEYFGPRPRFRGANGIATGAAATHPSFPPMYREAHGVNDKGLIFIRHGEPDEKLVTQPRPGVDLNESWRYANEGLDFHFMISNSDGIAYSWPLISYLGNCYMAEDRRHWGHLYSQIAPRPEAGDPRRTGRGYDPCGGERGDVDFLQAAQRLAEVGQTAIAEGLTTDRHTWDTREIESFDYPFDVVTFRGRDGRTDVSVYFAMPVGWFSEASSTDTLPVEIGFALHDSAYRAVVEERATREYRRTSDPTLAAFEEWHATVPPDSYRVSLHGELLGSPLLGGYQFGRRIPDYGRAATMMSDVVLAYDVRPKPGHLPTARSSLQITANPFHRAAIDRPLHAYFELYNLHLDEDDRSHYEVTYRLEPVKEGGILERFRRPDPGLSVSSTFEDATPSPIVFSEIDVSELGAGSYDLVVRVTDRTSGEVLERRLGIELYGNAGSN